VAVAQLPFDDDLILVPHSDAGQLNAGALSHSMTASAQAVAAGQADGHKGLALRSCIAPEVVGRHLKDHAAAVCRMDALLLERRGQIFTLGVSRSQQCASRSC